MLNYDKSSSDMRALEKIGVPYHEMNGYSVIEGEEYILREYHNNRREEGYEVPDKYQPQEKTRKENEIKFQSKMMADLEGKRVNKELEGGPDKYMWYEEEEMMLDPETKERIPIWLFEKRKRDEERHQGYLDFCRGKAKGKKRRESAKRLVNLKERKENKRKEVREALTKKLIEERKKKLCVSS